jgi:hypothetical protein
VIFRIAFKRGGANLAHLFFCCQSPDCHFPSVGLIEFCWGQRVRNGAAAAGRIAMKIQKMTTQIVVIRIRLPKDFIGLERIFVKRELLFSRRCRI